MVMKSRQRQAVCWLCALVWAGFQPSMPAAAEANPYLSIVERNPFGLKPIPPAPTGDEGASTNLPAKVTLTGLVTMFGEPRALLEISEMEGGKPGTPQKPILTQGQRHGSVELLAIDVPKNKVRIRNGTVEADLTFEVAKATAAPAGARPVPGMPQLPALPMAYARNPFGPGAAPPPGGVAPGGGNAFVVGPGSPTSSGSSGITLLGGGGASPAHPGGIPVQANAGASAALVPPAGASAPPALGLGNPNAAYNVSPLRRTRADLIPPVPPVPGR
jgi:hypothetical protein